MANYRPITTLPVLAKIFEKLVHKRMMCFIKRFNLLNTNHFGFLVGSSQVWSGLAKWCEDLSSLAGSNWVSSVTWTKYNQLHFQIELIQLHKVVIRLIPLVWWCTYWECYLVIFSCEYFYQIFTRHTLLF